MTSNSRRGPRFPPPRRPTPVFCVPTCTFSAQTTRFTSDINGLRRIPHPPVLVAVATMVIHRGEKPRSPLAFVVKLVTVGCTLPAGVLWPWTLAAYLGGMHILALCASSWSSCAWSAPLREVFS